MPPFDKTSDKSIPIDVEPDPLHTDIAGTSLLSKNSPIRSCLRKGKENGECIDRIDTKMKKSLYFHDTTTILWIEGIDSMSETEIVDCYYTCRDYTCFRDRERRISRNFSNWGFMKPGRKGEYLGVESRLQRFHRRQRTKNAVFSVLLEQELRIENSRGHDSLIEDDLAIARVYQQHTNESARLARERANMNASQVERTHLALLYQNRPAINDMEVDKKEEDTHLTKKKFELPWEVPAFNKSRLYNNGPSDMIKYSTCSYPVLPSDFFETAHCNDHNGIPKIQQDYRYLYQNTFEERGTLNETKSPEAPVEQKIVRPQENYEFNNAMVHPHSLQHPATTRQSYPHVLHQQRTWNQMPRNTVPSAYVPQLLPY